MSSTGAMPAKCSGITSTHISSLPLACFTSNGEKNKRDPSEKDGVENFFLYFCRGTNKDKTHNTKRKREISEAQKAGIIAMHGLEQVPENKTKIHVRKIFRQPRHAEEEKFQNGLTNHIVRATQDATFDAQPKHKTLGPEKFSAAPTCRRQKISKWLGRTTLLGPRKTRRSTGTGCREVKSCDKTRSSKSIVVVPMSSSRPYLAKFYQILSIYQYIYI